MSLELTSIKIEYVITYKKKIEYMLFILIPYKIIYNIHLRIFNLILNFLFCFLN
jgi:hypothetical protein